MPAIRDWTLNSLSANATTMPAFLPQYVTGDLLLAVFTCKTAVTAIAATGWTQLGTTVTNTAVYAIFYKIAGASETDPTFTWTTTNTPGIRILSIQDVNTTTPFNGTGGAATGLITANFTNARAAMPQLTTTVNNSLVLYNQVTSTALIPTILEGPVIFEDGADFTTHSEGTSWGFQATAGATSTAVFRENLGSAGIVGIAATIAISPPATGATVIPAYCSSDASIYVDPISGTTAYNGNTAFAATAITNFGSTLNGKTLVNGTAAAATDVGLNSYHSMGQITGTTTAGTWYGATLNPATANRPTALGKNILVHTKPSTPKVLQNTDGIGRVGTKGIAFGIATTANSAYKVWHTHGQGTSFDNAQHVPMVINSNNTSGLIQSTGTLVDPIISFGFFISGEVTAPIWQFGSLWVLDTITIVGGNSAYPIDTRGIVKVAATGKERLSVLQQGINQALIMQPIQFGNGGTNPTYLNLDSSAIEFPKQYDINKKQVFYCSVDNAVGITYYAGAGDTIIHSNATIISQNKYTWGFNASTSASATYNFAGTVINGAGTITLSSNVPLTSVAFTNCDQIPANGATLTSCTFTATTATSTQGAVSITGSSQALLQAALDKLVSCQFNNNTTSSGALRIIYTGTATNIALTTSTLTFSGNTKDIYFDAPAGSSLVFTCTGTSNALTSASTNSNSVTIQNVTTFGKITFASTLVADGANAVYRVFYKQINVAGQSYTFGTKNCLLVKSLSTDLSGDGSFEVKGDLTGNPTSATFNFDFTGNTQAIWTKNTTYFIGDEYLYVGTWYRVTANYTSGATRTSILDGTNSIALTGPTIVLVAIGRTNSTYFKVEGTLVQFQTTVIAATNTQEVNYSG
jgi:hypothetical protein